MSDPSYATIHLAKTFTHGRLAGITIHDRLTIRSAEEFAGWQSHVGQAIRSGRSSYVLTDIRVEGGPS